MLRDTERILRLGLEPPQAGDWAPDWFSQLRGVQQRALLSMRANRGLLGIIGCGQGKFLISVLAANAIECDRPVLLVPAPLRNQTQAELERWRERFPIHPHLAVFSYHDLSSERGWAAFVSCNADLIVADEAHNLRHRDSARTRRLLHWFRQHEACRFVALSGTMASRSVLDFAHLAELALRSNSPLPLDYPALQSWSAVVDHRPRVPASDYDRAVYHPIEVAYPAKTPRDSLYSLLATVPGVILTTATSAAECSLYVEPLPCPHVEPIAAALRELRSKWVLPDGEELLSAAEVALQARCLRSGYYYSHDYRRPEWAPHLRARQEWASALREVLARRYHGVDSIAQAEAWVTSRPDHEFYRLRSAWEAARGAVSWDPVVRWVSEAHVAWLVSTIGELEREDPILVWVESPAMMQALGERGLLVCRPGQEVPQAATVVVSRRSHGTGYNLQGWCRSLVAELPTCADAWEQLLARTHREGQEADDVRYWVACPNQSAINDLRSVLEGARFIETVTGQRQKILQARITGALAHKL